MIALAYCLQKVWRPWNRERESSGLPELNRWNWEFKDAKAARVFRAEYQSTREEESSQRENSRDIQRLPPQLSTDQLIHVEKLSR